MAYTLNGVDLGDYGFIPGKAEGSNLAVLGCFDFPSRMGKTFHAWGDENGVEMYVAAEEIRFAGRDIVLHGIIKGADQEDCLAKAYDLQREINQFTDLVELACDWGTWDVLISGKIEIAYRNHGVATIVIPFREPVVDLTGGDAIDTFLPGENIKSRTKLTEVTGIDGVTFAELGMTLLKKLSYIDRPEPKPAQWSNYDTEGHQVMPTNEYHIDIRGLIQADDYAGFQTILKTLYGLFKKPGLRYLTEGYWAMLEFFVPNGFEVSETVVASDGTVTAVIDIPAVYNTAKGDPVILFPDAASHNVYAIAEDANGDLYLGGLFTNYAGTAANRIVKIFGSGPNIYEIDTSFDYGAGFNSQVNCLAIDSAGRIVVGGPFTTYKGVAAPAIIRLNPDGSIDGTFNAGAGFPTSAFAVITMAIDADDKIYVGGTFTTYRGVGAQFIVRINTDGTTDTGFPTGSGLDGACNKIRLNSAGKIFCVGNFGSYKGVSANGVIKLNTDATKDVSFNNSTGFNSGVRDFVFDTSERLYCVGQFTTYKGITANGMALVKLDGGHDSNFSSGAGFDEPLVAIGIDAYNRLYCVGEFTTYKGIAEPYVIRLLPSGVKDVDFINDPGLPGPVYDVISYTTAAGSVFIAGLFPSFNGEATENMIKFNFYES